MLPCSMHGSYSCMHVGPHFACSDFKRPAELAEHMGIKSALAMTLHEAAEQGSRTGGACSELVYLKSITDDSARIAGSACNPGQLLT